MPVTLTPITPSAVTGYYADESDLYAVAGERNVIVYSNIDGSTTTADTTREQRALDWGDAKVNSYLASNGIASPIADTNPHFALLTEAAARYAVKWLYNSRGSRDSDESPEGPDKAWKWEKQADAALACFAMMYRSGAVALTGYAAGYPRAV